MNPLRGAWALVACALIGVVPPANAQPYPNKPINLIVGTAPGGGFDLVARRLEKVMSKNLGQSIVVTNRPGAGSLVGTMAVLNAPADGYTLGMGGLSNLVFNGALYKHLPYKPQTDFTPIGIVAESPYVLISRLDLPFKDLAGLVKFARANPGKLNIATAGVGTGQQVLAAAVLKDTGLSLTQIPYQGAQPVYTDLLGGRIDLFIDTLPSARRFIDARQVNAIFTTGGSRDATSSTIPTAAEAGFPGLQMTSWFGLVVSSKVPALIVDRLSKALEASLADKEFRAELVMAGFDPKPYIKPQDTAKFIQSEYSKWTAVIKEAGLTAD